MTQIDSHSPTNRPLHRVGLWGRLAATAAGPTRRRLPDETRWLLPLVAPVVLGGGAAVAAAAVAAVSDVAEGNKPTAALL
jgi:hypothetical protein